MANYCDCCGSGTGSGSNSGNGSTSGSVSGSIPSTPAVLNGKIYAPEYMDAYQIAVNNGFKGTLQEWLASLHGTDGLSAYELAVQCGFEGSVRDWLISIRGETGLSAYQLAKREGYEGSLDEWLESLRGTPGKNGKDGVSDHQELTGRKEANCHPISAIKGLEPRLDDLHSEIDDIDRRMESRIDEMDKRVDSKQNKLDVMSALDVLRICR